MHITFHWTNPKMYRTIFEGKPTTAGGNIREPVSVYIWSSYLTQRINHP